MGNAPRATDEQRRQTFEPGGTEMGRFRRADACEYGRGGVLGWAQEHALLCAAGAVIAWLAVVYAVISTVLALAY
jgi:hypothetical protein